MSLRVRMGALLTSLVTMKLRTLGSRVKSELIWAKSGTYTSSHHLGAIPDPIS